jgi:hypothetical protein
MNRRAPALLAFCILACANIARAEDTDQLPPLLAESDEKPAAGNAAILNRCLSTAQPVAAHLHFALGAPQFSHSPAWGDLVRIALDDTKKGLSSRIVCSVTKVSMGVTPSGEPLPVPAAMRGIWASSGKCDDKSRWLVVTATAVKPGPRDAFEVRYFARYGTSARGVLFSTDGSFQVPQYDARLDAMVWRLDQGTARFLRCPIAE